MYINFTINSFYKYSHILKSHTTQFTLHYRVKMEPKVRMFVYHFLNGQYLLLTIRLIVCIYNVIKIVYYYFFNTYNVIKLIFTTIVLKFLMQYIAV